MNTKEYLLQRKIDSNQHKAAVFRFTWHNSGTYIFRKMRKALIEGL